MWLSQNGIFYFFISYHSPFSSYTIFFISRLRVNLWGRLIHQIEAWDWKNILCIIMLTLLSYDVTIWRHYWNKISPMLQIWQIGSLTYETRFDIKLRFRNKKYTHSWRLKAIQSSFNHIISVLILMTSQECSMTHYIYGFY